MTTAAILELREKVAKMRDYCGSQLKTVARHFASWNGRYVAYQNVLTLIDEMIAQYPPETPESSL